MRKLLKFAEKYLVHGLMDRIGLNDLFMWLAIMGAAIYSSVLLIQYIPVLSITVLGLSGLALMLPLLSFSVESALRLINRPKVLSDGTTIDGELYAAAAYRLKARGISDTKGFINEHVQHAKVASQMSRECHVWAYENSHSIPSLVYTSDGDPEATREAIISIITQRGITKAEDIKELLETRSGIESPLLDGAL